MRLPEWHDITELEPAWYGAAAAVAGALAVLVPGHRLLAGAAGGVAVLAIGLLRKQGGCSCGGTATAPTAKPSGIDAPAGAPLDFHNLFEGAGNMAIMQPRSGGCA